MHAVVEFCPPMKKYKNNLREKKYKIKCIDFMDVFKTKQFCLDKQKLISKSTRGTLKLTHVHIKSLQRH